MKAHIATTRRELVDWQAQWEDLLKRSEANSIFLTPEWIFTWLDEVNPRADLFFVLVEEGGRLAGIAPFYISRLQVFGRFRRLCLRIAGDEHASSEYLDLVALPELEEQVIDQIASTLRLRRDRWQLMWVPYCADLRGGRKRLQLLCQELNLYYREREFEYFVVNLSEGEEGYWNSLSSKQRNNIRRYIRRLSAEGDLRLVDLVAELGPTKAFDALVELHGVAWDARGEPGAFRRHPGFKRFTSAFVNRAAERDWVVINGLMRRDELIAARLGYRYDGNLVEIQSGFCPDLNGSGIVSVYWSIMRAIRENLTAYDFLAGAGHYKQQLGAKSMPGVRLFAGRRSPINWLCFRLGIWPSGRYMRFVPASG